MKAYRAWINQPSTLSPLHHLHGKFCIVVDEDATQNTVDVYFTEGLVHSMQVLRLWVSRVYLSDAETK